MPAYSWLRAVVLVAVEVHPAPVLSARVVLVVEEVVSLTMCLPVLKSLLHTRPGLSL